MSGLIDSCFLCQKIQFRQRAFCRSCSRALKENELIRREVKGLEIFSLLHYAPPATGLLKLCKQPSFRDLTREMSRLLAGKVAFELMDEVCGVIPMPPRQWGGQDHAYFVAEAAATVFRAPLACRFLERATLDSQKEKAVADRAKVKLLRREPLPLSDLTGGGLWLLVDDVVTTGATLYEAWKLLGQPRAAALALASTPRHENFAGLATGFTRAGLGDVRPRTNGNYWENLIKGSDAMGGFFTPHRQPISLGEDQPPSSRSGAPL